MFLLMLRAVFVKYSKLRRLFAVFGLCLSQQVLADLPAILFPPQGTVYNFDDEFDKKPWQEVETQLPPAPREDRLISFYVSPTAQGVFSIDASTLSVGADGVVRYVLVIVAQGGARNVSYEGLRCDTRERRLYAFGRPDGSWSKARSNQWVLVENKMVNRHHAALSREYFCPGGVAIRTAQEGVAALKAGGHPDVPR